MAYKKYRNTMNLAQSLACAVKIANGAPCSTREMAAALSTIGWAKKHGKSWFNRK